MKKRNETKKITKKMGFSEILEKYPKSAEFFLEKGMYCCGCPMAMSESLEQGALAHGLDANKLVKEINSKLKDKKKK